MNELQAYDHHLSHDHQELAVSGSSVVESWAVEGGWYVSPRLMTADGATRAGVLASLLDAGDAPLMEVRVITLEGVGEWMPLENVWSEEDQHVAIAELGTTGIAAEMRILRTDVHQLDLLRFAAVVPELIEELGEDELPEVDAASAEIRSELRGIGIVTREQWGALPTRCTSSDSSKRRFAIHHTVTASSDPARQMRGIQSFHMNTHNWCDVGYHFLVGNDGKIYEGRSLQLVGAHVSGDNRGNIGVSFIGCFHTSGCSGLGPTRPSDAMVNVSGRLLGTLSRLYGISLSSTTVRGHRDHPGQSTACPGDNLRPRIAEMITLGRSSTLSVGGGSTSPPPSSGSSFPAIEVHWDRQTDGRYELRALTPADVERVVYVVDGHVIGEATRLDGDSFPTSYAFGVERNARRFEVRGYDADNRQVGLGVGLFDVTAGPGVYVKQMGEGLYEIGLERAPAEVAAIEVMVDGRFTLTDLMSRSTRSTRGAVRSRFDTLGERSFAITTFDAARRVRGTLRRTFTLR